MKHAASPAGATDNLLLAVFNDLPPVAQGITALRRPPFKDECIQRFAHPLRERGFTTPGRLVRGTTVAGGIAAVLLGAVYIGLALIGVRAPGDITLSLIHI